MGIDTRQRPRGRQWSPHEPIPCSNARCLSAGGQVVLPAAHRGCSRRVPYGISLGDRLRRRRLLHPAQRWERTGGQPEVQPNPGEGVERLTLLPALASALAARYSVQHHGRQPFAHAEPSVYARGGVYPRPVTCQPHQSERVYVWGGPKIVQHCSGAQALGPGRAATDITLARAFGARKRWQPCLLASSMRQGLGPGEPSRLPVEPVTRRRLDKMPVPPDS